MRHVFTLGVVFLASVTTAGAGDEPPSTGATSSAFCSAGRFADKAFGRASIDSNWVEFERSLYGCRVTNKANRWAINAMWFQLPDSLGRLYTEADLHQLEARGVITDTVMVDIVSYRFLVPARSEAEAKEAAVRARAHLPPKWVLRRLGVSRR